MSNELGSGAAARDAGVARIRNLTRSALVGAALVIAAGLFVIFRERSLGIDRTLEREAETPPVGPAI